VAHPFFLAIVFIYIATVFISGCIYKNQPSKGGIAMDIPSIVSLFCNLLSDLIVNIVGSTLTKETSSLT